jgi:hypothetical protein
MILNVTILAMWSSQGIYSYGYGIDIMINYWAQHLNYSAKNIPDWPFDATVELVDYKSNVSYCTEFLIKRLNEHPKVSAILAPEGAVGGALAPIAAQKNIPYILTSSNPSPIYYDLPVNHTTSFYIEAPAMYTFRSLMETYVEYGVKTIATVAYSDHADAGYNYWSCYGSAEYLGASRGIDHVAHYDLYINSTDTDIEYIIRSFKQLQPDVILWCDWQSCTFNDTQSYTRFPLPYFEKARYLSKSFTLLDCFGTSPTLDFISHGWMDYITQPTFTHPSLKGSDYTEDKLSYGTVFRSNSPMNTVNEAMNFGSTPNAPSSVALFSDWYMNMTGIFPPYQSNGYWAALDLLESAIYRVAKNTDITRDREIDTADITALLINSQVSGMYGRVIFDAHRVNTPTPTIAIQLYPGKINPYIVSPLSQAEYPIIYPIPTWEERYYRWYLAKDANFISCIVIASLCTTLLLSMIVTLWIHKKENDVRMLHPFHMISVCGTSIVAIWSCVFLWQSDMNQTQCKTMIWFTYLPLSFVIMMMNMKAYRLSVFLHSEDRHRLKKLTHNRMLILSLGWTSLTAIVLLLISLVSPPILVKTVIDAYRPSLDIYTCIWRPNTAPVAYTLVFGHMIFSTGTVISVRNGTGEFRDGMVLKEAFVIFWFCVAIAYMIQLLGLNVSTTYVVRTSFISVGITFFCFRILISRCYRHWMPKVLDIFITKLMHRMSKIIPERKQSATVSLTSFETLDGPGYKNEEPELDDMYNALLDEERANKLRNYAEKALVVENVDFLLAVNDYRKKSAKSLIESSKRCSHDMQKFAHECFRKYMVVGCDDEVNVSSFTRQKTIAHIETWDTDEPLMNNDTAEYVLDDDTQLHIDVFQGAAKEIAIMLYQNIWLKYRAQEVEDAMG